VIGLFDTPVEKEVKALIKSFKSLCNIKIEKNDVYEFTIQLWRDCGLIFSKGSSSIDFKKAHQLAPRDYENFLVLYMELIKKVLSLKENKSDEQLSIKSKTILVFIVENRHMKRQPVSWQKMALSNIVK
jgi:hypothetical protein